MEINKFLFVLKECICVFDLGVLYVLFCGLKFMEVFWDLFLGDSRTVMIANIFSAEGLCEYMFNML